MMQPDQANTPPATDQLKQALERLLELATITEQGVLAPTELHEMHQLLSIPVERLQGSAAELSALLAQVQDTTTALEQVQARSNQALEALRLNQRSLQQYSNWS